MYCILCIINIDRFLLQVDPYKVIPKNYMIVNGYEKNTLDLELYLSRVQFLDDFS